jgi:hypothetical protein
MTTVRRALESDVDAIAASADCRVGVEILWGDLKSEGLRQGPLF